MAILDWLLATIRGLRCGICNDRYRNPLKLEAHVYIDHAGDPR